MSDRGLLATVADVESPRLRLRSPALAASSAGSPQLEATFSIELWVQRHEALILLCMIVAGMILRLWQWCNTIPRGAETMNVAISLARTGHFADAFRPGSGPTAHVAPIMPLLISAVYRVFGVSSPAAEVALSLIAVGLIGISIGLAHLLMRQLGMTLRTRLAAVALVSFLPVQFAMEVRELKVWEAPLAVVGITGLLALVVHLDLRGIRSVGSLFPAVVIAAFLALLSPPLGLAGFAVIAILTIRRVRVRHWPAVSLMTAIVTTSFILPWAAHNHAVFGKWIMTRSNANLELALAYNETMLRATDARLAFHDKIMEIHPVTPNGYIAMRAAGGEIAYYELLGQRLGRWVSGDPASAAVLLARHVRDYFIPPSLMTFQTSNTRSATLRLAFLAASAVLAIAGAPILIARNERYIYVFVAMGIMILPYILVEPIIRYRYLIYTLSVFLSVEIIRVSWARLLRGSSVEPGIDPFSD